MPLPIVIEDGREVPFRKANRIPPQTPIRTPLPQTQPQLGDERPDADGGQYIRIPTTTRGLPAPRVQGQPDRPMNGRQPLNGPTAPPQMVPQRPQAPARVRAEAPPREPKAKAVRDDGDEP
jgi:hypothetical protein